MIGRAGLFAFLDSAGIEHSTVEHLAVFRVGEGEDVKASIAGAHTKNLFLKDARGRLWLISAEQSTRIDLKALPSVIGSAKLSFGKPELLEATLGVTPGSVTALGLINDTGREVSFVVDRVLAEAAVVNFHPLENTATTSLSREGFRAFLAALRIAPVLVDFEAMQLAG